MLYSTATIWRIMSTPSSNQSTSTRPRKSKLTKMTSEEEIKAMRRPGKRTTMGFGICKHSCCVPNLRSPRILVRHNKGISQHIKGSLHSACTSECPGFGLAPDDSTRDPNPAEWLEFGPERYRAMRLGSSSRQAAPETRYLAKTIPKAYR